MSSSLADIFRDLSFKLTTKKPTVVEQTPPKPISIITSSTDSLPNSLPIYTLAEVAHHDTYTNCWIVVYDRVYDVTNFMHTHPGGEEVLMDHAGRDATLAFHGTGHSNDAIKLLSDYLIGELPLKERIFRSVQSKVLSLGIPKELE